MCRDRATLPRRLLHKFEDELGGLLGGLVSRVHDAPTVQIKLIDPATSASMYTLRANLAATNRATVDLPPPGGPEMKTRRSASSSLGSAGISRHDPLTRRRADQAVARGESMLRSGF